jgi:hypothetical protein
MRRSYRALADRDGVPHTTLHHRAHGRRSIEEKAQSQQYLLQLFGLLLPALIPNVDARSPMLVDVSGWSDPSSARYVVRQRPNVQVV